MSENRRRSSVKPTKKERRCSSLSEKVPHLELSRDASNIASKIGESVLTGSAGSGSSMSERSAGSTRSSPKSVYTAYNESDLYNDLRPDYDPTVPPTLCFQCGAIFEPLLLTRTVERTGYRFQQGTDIYRPIYSCTDCLEEMLQRKAQDERLIVKLDKRVLVLYS